MILLIVLCCFFSGMMLYAGEKTSIPETVKIAPEVVSERMQLFVQNIETFNQLFPQEKVYLHFDNTSYFVGETIWFKAYVVTSERHHYSTYSKVLYVELISQEGMILDRKRLKIEDGQCHGEFQLKPEYYGGYYEIRAYTQAMLNFGRIQRPYEKEVRAFFFNEDYVKTFFQENGTLFTRVFPVYNTPSQPGAYHQRVIRLRPKVTGIDPKKDPAKPPIDVQFYPEGGSLVDGLMSRVAFEARLEDGQPIDVEGVVQNDGKTFCRFKTAGKGRGDFYVQPDRKDMQRIAISYKDKSYIYQFPEVLAQGYVMTVTPVYHGNIQVNVQRSAGQLFEELGLSVICRGRPYIFNTLYPDSSGVSQMVIPVDMLPTGVNQLTLFNSSGEVFAERLVFVNHREYENCQIQVLGKKSSYKPYERVWLHFRLFEDQKQGKSQSSVQADVVRPISNKFSVSVCDEGTREANVSIQNARTNLLLSSDVHGYIENPEYYFEADNKRRHYELDLLLLVQGWRRYDWQEMSGNRPFEYLHRYEQDFELSGQVYPLLGLKKEQKKRLANGILVEATLLLDTMEYTGYDSTDTRGNFRFDLPEFDGEGVLFLKAVEKKEKWKEGSDFFQNDLRYEEKEGGHWLDAYMPLNENYIPHVRNLSYEEIHLKKAQMPEAESVLQDKKTDVTGISTTTAYQLDLPDVVVSRKRILHTIDYSQPAFKLDPFEEMNYQMDMGLFYGVISKASVAYNACVRLGQRGLNMELVNRRPLSETPDVDVKVEDYKTEEDYMYSDKISKVFFGNEWRTQEGEYYMCRYLRNVAAKNQNKTDNTRGNIPDSVAFRKYTGIENVEWISIYSDKNDRDLYSLGDVLKSYSCDFVINYECFSEKSQIRPVSKGRRLTYKGYSSVASFYQPDYSKLNPSDAPADYRRTLYWNPDVQPDSTGCAHIEFYNNSTAKSIYINAETVTKEGMPVVFTE